jgi:dTDP-4-amino-4,6-dideoxygalactose transaminase
MLQLKHMGTVMQRRAEIDTIYRDALKDIKGIQCLPQSGQTVANHSYFPVLVQADYPLDRDALYQKLKNKNIYARRYFYPLISDFPMYRGLPSAAPANLPVASNAAERILCLPIYPGLSAEQQQRVIDQIAGY